MLTFNEKEHKYYYGGKEIPSVSKIMESITCHFYGNIPQIALDIACDRGNQIHKAIYDYELFGDYKIEEKHKGYFESYLEFKEKYKPIYLYQEEMLTNGLWAGTTDAIATINGETWLIDWKTSRDLHKNLLGVQEYGYSELWAYKGVKIDKYGAVHLRKDGYEFVEIEPNKEMWECCYECWKFGKGE